MAGLSGGWADKTMDVPSLTLKARRPWIRGFLTVWALCCI